MRLLENSTLVLTGFYHWQLLKIALRDIHKILSHLKLQDVRNIFIVGDLKIYNVMLGISSHGGKYSCAFCLGISGLDSGTDRTFGHLQDHYSRYKKAGVNPKEMQKLYNTINECLIVANREERVLDKIMLPELHLMMGVVCHLFNLMMKVWPEILEWIKRNDVIRHGYQGDVWMVETATSFLES